MPRQKPSKTKTQESATAFSLPLALARFIGREHELAEVKRLLGTTRLLTLTGVGGSGKTRLAMHVAADVANAFKDGACWVDLAPLAEPVLVPQTVAQALGVRETPNQPLLESLMNHLRSKQLLLVLDNCEHLLRACSELSDTLLRASSRLTILATSREPLRIAGETTWLVPSLSLPPSQVLSRPMSDLTLTLLESDAIRLFVERATSVLPALKLANENAGAILQVCERLDGIPLAIELAAARVNVLTVQQIAARLDDRFHLLTSGVPSTLPRHRTLRAAIDWSYDLLSENERTLFRRLSIFAGGFTLEAAEAVCADQQIKQDQVLDLLSRLVDKSLVLRWTETDSLRARFYLLETMREYAREKLSEAGEIYRFKTWHLSFFLRLAENAEMQLEGLEQIAWLTQLDEERDNLRAGLDWAVATDPAAALRLAGALSLFWVMRSQFSEGRDWLEKILNLPRAADDLERMQSRAKALWGAGRLAGYVADYAAARRWLEESIALCRRIQRSGPSLTYPLRILAGVFLEQGNVMAARPLLEESLALARQQGDKWAIGAALESLGTAALRARDYASAETLLYESLALTQESGDAWGVAAERRLLAMIDFRKGNYAAARSKLEQGLGTLREVADQLNYALSLWMLAEILQHDRDEANSIVLYEESASMLRKLGNDPHLADCFAGSASLAYAQGQLERAACLFGAVDALCARSGYSPISMDRTDMDQVISEIQAGLTTDAFNQAWREGYAMPLERAIDLALAQANPSYIEGAQGARAESGGDTFATEPAKGQATAVEQAVEFTRSGPTLPVSAMPDLRVFALGPVQVHRGETLLTSSDWTLAKAKELFFYLLLNDARTKEQIGLDLWPDATPKKLRSNLKIAVHHLRRTLGRAEWILFDNDRYTFNRSLRYWFDVEEFESNLAKARPLQAQAPAQAIRLLQKATELYRGDLLEDARISDWYIVRREDLQRKSLEARLALGDLLLSQGRHADAIDEYQWVIRRDPYQEAAQRGLMRGYARRGELSQALRQYRSLVDLLRDELGGAPAPETTALFERLRRGEEA